MYARCMQFLSQYGKAIFIGSGIAAPIAVLGTSAVSGDVMAAHAPHYHWEYKDFLKSYDTAAIRRGWQVYKEVCASCHSMQYLCYRHMVGVIFTESQAKKEAAEAMIEDGPDEMGEMFLRPGVITDTVPSPYKNDNAARAANNGALPPDLSLMAGARHGEIDYLFSLLTGYSDEIPPGLTLEATQYCNPFMEGGVISMPPPLNDGAVEYPDGTPATVTQMARDVTEFLQWSLARHYDRQKQVGMYMALFFGTGVLFWYWNKRYMTSHIYTQRIRYKMRPYSH